MVFAGILAGGTGSRMGNAVMPKQFIEVAGVPIIVRTLRTFLSCERVDKIVVSMNTDWADRYFELAREFGLDTSRIWSWPTPWSSGMLSWKIPYGWKRKEDSSNICAGQISPPSYSVWTMSSNLLEKTKHSHKIGLSSSGSTYLDGNIQQEED